MTVRGAKKSIILFSEGSFSFSFSLSLVEREREPDISENTLFGTGNLNLPVLRKKLER